MSGPLDLVFDKVGVAGGWLQALFAELCFPFGAGSLFGLTAHTWRMINTLAALHIRSACRMLPVAEQPTHPHTHPHTLVPLCVLNYVCFMIYLTHPCKNVERALHSDNMFYLPLSA